MVQVFVGSCLGERLSVMAFGKAMALRRGCLFEPAGAFSGRGPSGCRGVVTIWEGQWPFDAQSGRQVEWAEIDGGNEPLLLKGSFQRYDLIAGYHDEIRHDWFDMPAAPPMRPAGDFLICLTASVSAPHGRPNRKPRAPEERVSFEDLRNLARTVPHERLWLLAHEPSPFAVRAAAALRAELKVPRDDWEEFLFVRAFQKVAIRQDAKQWWAAFLGGAREVYFPKIETGIWSKPQPANLAHDPWWRGIDLRVSGETRWIYDW